MHHGLIEATSAHISSSTDRKGPAVMADKTTAPAFVETAIRLLLAEGDGATGAARIAGGVRTEAPARSYPGPRRRERQSAAPFRSAEGYRAKPQRPLRIPGRG